MVPPPANAVEEFVLLMRLIRSSSSVETRPSSAISSCGVSAGASPSWTFALVSSLDFSCAILFWQSARRISASASFIFFNLQIEIASDLNESKYLQFAIERDWLREKESNLHL